MSDSFYTSRSRVEVLGPLKLPNDAISADAEGLHRVRWTADIKEA